MRTQHPILHFYPSITYMGSLTGPKCYWRVKKTNRRSAFCVGRMPLALWVNSPTLNNEQTSPWVTFVPMWIFLYFHSVAPTSWSPQLFQTLNWLTSSHEKIPGLASATDLFLGYSGRAHMSSDFCHSLPLPSSPLRGKRPSNAILLPWDYLPWASQKVCLDARDSWGLNYSFLFVQVWQLMIKTFKPVTQSHVVSMEGQDSSPGWKFLIQWVDHETRLLCAWNC